MKNADRIFKILCTLERELKRGISAQEISIASGIDRSNISRELKLLSGSGKIKRREGRPVLFYTLDSGAPSEHQQEAKIDTIARNQPSLQIPVQQAKAAILYPPRGLHTLILGETGVGKTMFAELMHQFARESQVIENTAPFISFNCADYTDNPQLVTAQIFGVKKGAYTGAERDREGLLEKADGGILFLDEVHRLPAQGQEMLFTYIDTGTFRPLGETEKSVSVSVQIIAATTEDPKHTLLNTFTRRIPMIITLPSLEEKGLEERYHLIEYFIKKESKRLGKSIYIHKNGLISFMLYVCPNNIGQLGSDIQLSCAKAFVNYKAKGEEYILIDQLDLPQHVKRGMMRINESRESLDQLLHAKGEILRFHHQEEGVPRDTKEYHEHTDFYDIIEKKLEKLISSGIGEAEINQILTIDIESHFQKYLGKLQEQVPLQKISQIVSTEVLEVVEEVLHLSQERLHRSFDKKIYYGLALHIQCFIERMQKGARIFHPRLNAIRIEYPEEFSTAMEVIKVIDRKFQIHAPLDEIGYLTLFLTANPSVSDITRTEKVGVLVIMHGKSTASSMVEVCNTLVGEDHAAALDMPLSMKPMELFERAKAEVRRLNQGKGILLLVDMGSLTNFGDMIYEETGIIVRTITAVSTPMVLAATRKAILGIEMNQIYAALQEESPLDRRMEKSAGQPKVHCIITACYTGEGAAEGLKKIIMEGLGETVEILPLNIISRKGLVTSIRELKEKFSILAIVSTVEVQVDGIPSISAAEIIAGEGLKQLREIVLEEEKYLKIGKALQNHVQGMNGERVIEEIRHVIKKIERVLKVIIKEEAAVGIVLHMSFLIDRLKSGGKEAAFPDLYGYKDQFNREMILIKKCLKPLEETYHIGIGDHELAHLCKMTLENDESVERAVLIEG